MTYCTAATVGQILEPAPHANFCPTANWARMGTCGAGLDLPQHAGIPRAPFSEQYEYGKKTSNS